MCLTALRVLNWQDSVLIVEQIFSRELCFISSKCAYSKETILSSATSCQYTGSSSNMAVDDSHSILNYVLLVGANNYVQVQNDCFFSLFFNERFFLIKQMLYNVWKICSCNPSTVLILFPFWK
jgi:hypothetical protein